MGCQHSKHSQIQTSLIKIQVDGVFWFKGDLGFVNNKNTLKQHRGWWKMTNNKRTKILIRNDKMTINNLVKVSNGMLKTPMAINWTWKFSFWAIRGHQEVEGRGLLDTMLMDTKDIKKYIIDFTNIRVKNILYLIFFRIKDCWETW